MTKARNRLTLAQVSANLAHLGEWREAKGFSNHFASSGGHVWSCRSQRLVTGCKAGAGYRRIARKSVPSEYVHRIVCRTFHGDPIPADLHTRHLNGDLSDNRASNLAWGTRADNEADKDRHGNVLRGERCPASKLTADEVDEMRSIRAQTGQSYADLGHLFNVSGATAHRAVTGETWRA